jgi:hypothetical protein
MRKFILPLAAFAVMLATNVGAANKINGKTVIAKTENNNWMKDSDGAWEGKKDGKTYWYKLDKSAKLWWSTDGKKWEAAGDNTWADNQGHWLTVKNNKLEWSTDMGKTWSAVPDMKWEGSDGKWYKFDKDWTLWVNK